MDRKFHDPVKLNLEAIQVRQPKTLLITLDQLPEKKTKMIVIHCGVNGITNKANRLQKIRKEINATKENDVNDEIEIVLSSVIKRNDQDVEDEINELNKNFANLCIGKSMRFIGNSNIKKSPLNKSKLHLNKSRTVLFRKHLQN